MDSQQAKEILVGYRHGTDDAADPFFSEALQAVERDPVLRKWFEQQRYIDAGLRDKFSKIDVPENLCASILEKQKVVPFHVWWKKPAWIAAAAGVVLLVTASALLLGSRPSPALLAYRKAMVDFALHGYNMDMKTSDDAQLRQAFGQKHWPGDYRLPEPLALVRLEGGAALTWSGHKVNMLCFRTTEKRSLWLFVIDRTALPDAPADKKTKFATIEGLTAMMWSDGGKTYMLTGEVEPDSLKKLL